MGDIPRSVRLKLGRVEQHMKALDEAIQSFLDSKPYEIERLLERDGHDHVFYWRKISDTPDCFGLIAGDAIHNLRSSLDHMAVALAMEGAKVAERTLSKTKLRDIRFPIASTHSEFVNQVEFLHFVSPAAKTFIEGFQVYKLGLNKGVRSHLAVITDMDNADKHRLLTTTTLAPRLVTIGWSPANKSATLQEPALSVPNQVGTEFGRFVFPVPEGEMDVRVEPEWGFCVYDGVGWSRWDIRYFLDSLIKTGRSIIRDLSTKFIEPLEVFPSNLLN
jgi:hypothetical protein